MGYYTYFEFNFRLKKDTPDEVLDILDLMINKEESKISFEDVENKYPNEPLFNTKQKRWRYMFEYSEDENYSFITAIEQQPSKIRWIILHVFGSIKDYEYETNKFISWIKPYIGEDENKIIGYKQGQDQESLSQEYGGESLDFISLKSIDEYEKD
jgi:hypothetical protein